jgi:hypothetical protein
MSRGPDAATLLTRALTTSAATAGCPVEIADSDWTRWASATFTGARHLLALRGEASSALDAWLAALPEADIALRGHLVADVVIGNVRHVSGTVTISLEVLTVEER